MESGYKQGVFKPQNSKKYLGSSYPVYRSGWELKFFRWADLNERVLAWGSETIIVPYINPLDNKVHRYFVDNFVIFKDKEGNKQKFLIEINDLMFKFLQLKLQFLKEVESHHLLF